MHQLDTVAPPRSWALIVAGSDLNRGSVLPYREDPKIGYRWTSNVPNHARVQVGDLVAIRDKEQVLGASIVEAIERLEKPLITRSCPRCLKSQFRIRKKKSPRYRCVGSDCLFEFDEPTEKFDDGIEYLSTHEAHWIDLSGTVSARELKDCYPHPESQLSIRALDWSKFLTLLKSRTQGYSPSLGELSLLSAQQQLVISDDFIIKGGHRIVVARSRIGQCKFRSRLLESYGSTCFISGVQPPQALDAAHLYSFAATGDHTVHGGILLRKDLHSLFDLKMLSVNVSTWKIELNSLLLGYPDYARFQGLSPQFELQARQTQWSKIHYESFIAQ